HRLGRPDGFSEQREHLPRPVPPETDAGHPEPPVHLVPVFPPSVWRTGTAVGGSGPDRPDEADAAGRAESGAVPGEGREGPEGSGQVVLGAGREIDEKGHRADDPEKKPEPCDDGFRRAGENRKKDAENEQAKPIIKI